jgi:thioredoxin-like negative regulator of GroEL
MKNKIKSRFYWLFGLFIFFGWASIVWGQDATDKDFKDKTRKGFVVVKFTSKWQGTKIDDKLFGSVKGHEGTIILTVKQEDTKKVCKKLRLRNFPSVVLFYNGKKKETWKADMDGQIEIKTSEIKSAIDDVLAEDVF